MISETAGVPVRVVELTEEEGRAHFGRFTPPHIAAAIVELIADALNGGSPAATTAEEVLGRAPASFADWARDHGRRLPLGPRPAGIRRRPYGP